MKRLTRNQDKFWGKGNYKGNKYIIGCDGVTSKQMIIDKLGKLEDLEEEIGCPLDVVFKATAQKKVFAGTCWLGKLSLEYISKDNEWWLTNGWTAYSVRLKDYQKTWWLKEDKSE